MKNSKWIKFRSVLTIFLISIEILSPKLTFGVLLNRNVLENRRELEGEQRLWCQRLQSSLTSGAALIGSCGVATLSGVAGMCTLQKSEMFSEAVCDLFPENPVPALVVGSAACGFFNAWVSCRNKPDQAVGLIKGMLISTGGLLFLAIPHAILSKTALLVAPIVGTGLGIYSYTGVMRGIDKGLKVCLNRIYPKSRISRQDFSDSNSENLECVICQGDFEDGHEISVLPCGHAFHKDCIASWHEVNTNCPLCRAPGESIPFKFVENSDSTEEGDANASD